MHGHKYCRLGRQCRLGLCSRDWGFFGTDYGQESHPSLRLASSFLSSAQAVDRAIPCPDQRIGGLGTLGPTFSGRPAHIVRSLVAKEISVIFLFK